MSNFFKVEDRTTDFLVRLVRDGERYGKWDPEKKRFPIVHQREDGKPFQERVEFYDLRCKGHHEPFNAYLVSSYQLGTILEGAGGINLAGGEPKYEISDEAMRKVRLWLRAKDIVSEEADDPVIAERVTVAGRNDGNSNPVLRMFEVLLRQSQYDLGEHWEIAEKQARASGIEGPYVSFDSSEDSEIVSAGIACTPDRKARPDDRFVDVQLIALRWLQECLTSGIGYDMSHLAEIADPGSITAEEIDHFCELINFGIK